MKITLNRALGSVAAVMAIVIIAGTVLAFCTHTALPGKYTRKADPLPRQINGSNAFDEIGQIRTITKPEKGNTKGTVLVVNPWLSYPTKDRAFHEELSQKSRQIKAIFTEYFSRYTEKELLRNGENAVKADLLHEINAQLVMGKIIAVYFCEYMFLE